MPETMPETLDLDSPPLLSPLVLPAVHLGDLDALLRREWLETNGLGSFAMGTVADAATRRYHALLCAATQPPVGRMVLVNAVEQAIFDGAGEHPFATHLYPGAVHPDGWRALTDFRLSPWPIWTWRVGRFTVERELFMARGIQATFVRWRVRGGRVGLLVRPLLSGRDYHALHHENGTLDPRADIRDRRVSFTPYAGVPTVQLHHPEGRYTHEPEWYRRFVYPVERDRGLDCEEDLWSPGEITYTVSDGGTADLVITTEARERWDVAAIARQERTRRSRVIAGIPDPRVSDSPPDSLARRLVAAADQFLVERAGGASVIAGYPWFTDWGRDTFIALPGLTLATGRLDVARAILAAFAPWVDGGMIPNRFPDAGEAAEYNTVDASLWYVIAIGQYLDAAARAGQLDDALVDGVLWPAVQKIVEGYQNGTRYGIYVDGDGLVAAGLPGVQLTWMDAKVGDWVVTPRIGKPVEIQALWIRALDVAARLGERAADRLFAREARRVEALARQSLSLRFWSGGGWLRDVVDGPGGSWDGSLRPNQLYALALDPPVFDDAQARQALDAVERELLTPFGLRTLSASDPAYLGRCVGSQHDRDAAYHQGTVWPHLLGIYDDAVLRVRGRRSGPALVEKLRAHLGDAGLGQVSEIFDGDAPHEPRGCIAQAWAVAELLRLTLS